MAQRQGHKENWCGRSVWRALKYGTRGEWRR